MRRKDTVEREDEAHAEVEVGEVMIGFDFVQVRYLQKKLKCEVWGSL